MNLAMKIIIILTLAAAIYVAYHIYGFAGVLQRMS